MTRRWSTARLYPYLDVQPKAYRFRILNAANDRMWNLQLYKASTIVGEHHRSPAAAAATRRRRWSPSRPPPGDTTGMGATATATIDPVTGATLTGIASPW